MLTFEVFNEGFQFHLSSWFDIGVVQVGVQHDDGEGNKKDGIHRVELFDEGCVT